MTKIPKIVHQTSKSRCLHPKLIDATRRWQTLDDHSYYFHDDDALMTIFLQEFPKFPHLAMIAKACLVDGTLRADVWRYLVIWVYGGMYADLDSPPNHFTAKTIRPNDDAFFVVEHYGLLSQYFMAASPRHPVMYYALHVALKNLLRAEDIGRVSAPGETGPHCLHQAFQLFMNDVGIILPNLNKGNVTAGYYRGTGGRSITAVGKAKEQSNEIIIREVVEREEKKKCTLQWA